VITLSIVLFISVCINILLVWYCRRLTKQFIFFTQNVVELENKLNSFDSHLGSVHELEMFYGDDTLGGLIEHSRSVVESIKQFNDEFMLDDEEIEEESGFEE
tara:strand:- start:1356 stop:1661 length:306 start_codon:yes stop_codon:yes gene_type:complete